MRRPEALLVVAVCVIWPALSLAGGNLRGTVVLPAPAPTPTDQAATCFWRLGPIPAPSAAREIPSVVLEGSAAAEIKLDATAAPPELRFEGYGIWPATLVVPKGSRVLLRNLDDRVYRCKAAGGPEPLGLEKLDAGEAKQLTLDLPGTHELTCESYPFMQARIVVAPSPLLTRVEDGDKFAFTNVPAGTYTARVYVGGAWQLEREVEIINLGTARLELAAGQAAGPAVEGDRPSGQAPEEAKPAPAEADKPRPVEVDKPKPVAADKPKPVAADKPKPVAADKPRPAEADKPKPVEADKPKPVAADKPKPAEADKPKPKSKPDKPKKPEAEPAFKDVEPEIEIETE